MTTLYRSLFLIPLLLIAVSAHAATLSIEFAPHPAAPDTVVTGTVFLESGADSLNAVEGTLTIPDAVSVVSVRTGDSSATLWPTTPVYVIKDRTIAFAGGTPAGFAPHAALFTFTASASALGTFSFGLKDAAAYRNDGKGTEVALTLSSGAVVVSKDGGVASAPAQDTEAPVFTDVSIGQDDSLFGGKQFIAFSATDVGSGIASYEVREGIFGSWKRAERSYVLADQARSKQVSVRATDNAGNTTITTVLAAHPQLLPYYLVALLVGVALVVFMLRRRKRTHAKPQTP